MAKKRKKTKRKSARTSGRGMAAKTSKRTTKRTTKVRTLTGLRLSHDLGPKARKLRKLAHREGLRIR